MNLNALVNACPNVYLGVPIDDYARDSLTSPHKICYFSAGGIMTHKITTA